MTRQEKVVLAMLVTIGATAVDTGLMEEKRSEFEQKFGVTITHGDIIAVINKMKSILSGSEEVVID